LAGKAFHSTLADANASSYSFCRRVLPITVEQLAQCVEPADEPRKSVRLPMTQIASGRD
jgi:hypothetical protein